MAEIVLCYARRDGELVRSLRSCLRTQGFDVWVDWEQVGPLECWKRAVFSAIDAASAVYFVATPASVSSRNCRAELGHALRSRKYIRVIPAFARRPGVPAPCLGRERTAGERGGSGYGCIGILVAPSRTWGRQFPGSLPVAVAGPRPVKRGPFSTAGSPPERVQAFFARRSKVVLSFLGYYGAGYENERQMLDDARSVLAAFPPRETIVNIGAMRDGIGQAYGIAKQMGFETTGIVSTRARAAVANVSPHVDQVFFIEDASWGGFLAGTHVLSPTSRVVVECSDVVVAIGGNAVTRDELIAAQRLGKTTRYLPADMNHAKAMRRAHSAGQRAPTDFRGEAYAAFAISGEPTRP